MEILFLEVIYFIKSFEIDCVEVEEVLKRYRLRRKKINMKIDFWLIWKF